MLMFKGHVVIRAMLIWVASAATRVHGDIQTWPSVKDYVSAGSPIVVPMSMPPVVTEGHVDARVRSGT